MSVPLLTELNNRLQGEVLFDAVSCVSYATDASAYFEKPLGVAFPYDAVDLSVIIEFANTNTISLIPRAAGTSLAGQVVGSGLVVDIGRHMNQIIEVNAQQRWVKVQPGVVLEELNLSMAHHQLFFGPETSTSNRCMLGGMLGNNSCGAHSLVYGSVRDHVLELKGFLSSGEEVIFKSLSKQEFEAKCLLDTHEGSIYRGVKDRLANEDTRRVISQSMPHADIHRRNTGYALDLLMNSSAFVDSSESFNMCKLIAGSEGTLFFVTELKLQLVDLPPKHVRLVCLQFSSLEKALEANLLVLDFCPRAVELMDKLVLDLTKDNVLQNKNRFFIQGDPEALLLIEFAAETEKLVEQLCEELLAHFMLMNWAYASSVLVGNDINKVWSLRKAGLGVLANMPGDERPVPVIEDTAVRPSDLMDYVGDIKTMLRKYNKDCVFYGHAGSGELHLRPVLNMKLASDVELFSVLALETAHLVKKYKGSLSGEHGDGRLRGQFISLMVGDEVNQLFEEVKYLFDPNYIFNPGKITQTPLITDHLRYKVSGFNSVPSPVFSWDSTLGMLRAAEKCSGSGDCRKSHLMGGTMCPSYMATRNEMDSTRARANVLREFLLTSEQETDLGFDDVKTVMALCLSCKACKSECPSNVDVTKLKAEFSEAYHRRFGISFRTYAFAYFSKVYKLARLVYPLFNKGVQWSFVKKMNERIVGLSSKRTLPLLSKESLKRWATTRPIQIQSKKVHLFADEFTNQIDSVIGIKAVRLLEKLGYEVHVTSISESGRSFLSKGLLSKAKIIAELNVSQMADLVTDNCPLVGVEPSAILTFRDEYPDLVSDALKSKALDLARSCFTMEEFLAREYDAQRIETQVFVDDHLTIRFHAHCYQKALSSTALTKKVLEIPVNYTAEEIPSGCCGMAGSFGFETANYDLSMKIGELVLFPDVRAHQNKSLIVAAGTSCRHQIKDGTGVTSVHPVEVLYNALKVK